MSAKTCIVCNGPYFGTFPINLGMFGIRITARYDVCVDHCEKLISMQRVQNEIDKFVKTQARRKELFIMFPDLMIDAFKGAS